MIPEIEITCGGGTVFINSVTVGQYRKYVSLMEKNGSDRITDTMFFNKKIIQEIFGNRMSFAELGAAEAADFLTAVKGIHFIMQNVISEKLLTLVDAEPVEREESAFDEYDIENGYEDDSSEDKNPWKICGEVLDRVIKAAIRLLKSSYSQCMEEDIISLLEYLKFELDTVNENQ
ncbi:hypothetical protein D3Z60_22400 [Lachnospiraceae bacterium]|nr:hypothetical protein [Lachnospiraceae bacterium]